MKNEILNLVRIAFISTLMLSMVSSVSAKGESGEYKTGFIRWRAAEGGFGQWTLNGGVKLNASGTLEFDGATASSGTDPLGDITGEITIMAARSWLARQPVQ